MLPDWNSEKNFYVYIFFRRFQILVTVSCLILLTSKICYPKTEKRKNISENMSLYFSAFFISTSTNEFLLIGNLGKQYLHNEVFLINYQKRERC